MGLISSLIILRVGTWISARIPRRLRRPLAVLTFVLVSLLVWYHFQPPASTVRAAVIFNAARLGSSVRGAAYQDPDAWMRVPGRWEVEVSADIGYLIKTGYGTRGRVKLMRDAYDKSGGILGDEGVLVVGDWDGNDGVVDALSRGWQMMEEFGVEDDNAAGAKRRKKHGLLKAAIESGDEEKALELGKEFGWELDALKFIPGMYDLYNRYPEKKWYIILDDDTYLVRPTLEMLLSHLDPDKPHYIGNAVGDFRARFAHGGSGIIISRKAMQKFATDKAVIATSLAVSLVETWGDKLVATTLQQLGIYLEERYAHHFNGEPPEITRVAAERFCAPIVSFHSLRTPTAMDHLARSLRPFRKPISWGKLLEIFGMPTTSGVIDRVGPLDDKTTTWKNVKTADECRRKCEVDSKRWCLAWKHDGAAAACHASPWVVPGEQGSKDITASGVHEAAIVGLRARCAGD